MWADVLVALFFVLLVPGEALFLPPCLWRGSRSTDLFLAKDPRLPRRISDADVCSFVCLGSALPNTPICQRCCSSRPRPPGIGNWTSVPTLMGTISNLGNFWGPGGTAQGNNLPVISLNQLQSIFSQVLSAVGGQPSSPGPPPAPGVTQMSPTIASPVLIVTQLPGSGSSDLPAPAPSSSNPPESDVTDQSTLAGQPP